jgi:hypothetical protein
MENINTIKLSLEQLELIQSITLECFKSFGKIQDVKVYHSDAFLNVAIYPEYNLILNSIDIEEYGEKQKENGFEIKHSPELIIIEFDIVAKCITLSFNIEP